VLPNRHLRAPTFLIGSTATSHRHTTTTSSSSPSGATPPIVCRTDGAAWITCTPPPPRRASPPTPSSSPRPPLSRQAPRPTPHSLASPTSPQPARATSASATVPLPAAERPLLPVMLCARRCSVRALRRRRRLDGLLSHRHSAPVVRVHGASEHVVEAADRDGQRAHAAGDGGQGRGAKGEPKTGVKRVNGHVPIFRLLQVWVSCELVDPASGSVHCCGGGLYLQNKDSGISSSTNGA
jgi:hypothetical protein